MRRRSETKGSRTEDSNGTVYTPPPWAGRATSVYPKSTVGYPIVELPGFSTRDSTAPPWVSDA